MREENDSKFQDHTINILQIGKFNVLRWQTIPYPQSMTIPPKGISPMFFSIKKKKEEEEEEEEKKCTPN